jgi:hypothetical protein
MDARSHGRPESTWQRWGAIGFIVVLACGIILRLIWPEVMEYKADEVWLFEKCMNIGRTEPIPATAMHASVGPNNPAQALLVWVGLARLFDVHEPPELGTAIHIINIAALLLLAAFARWGVRPEEREPWLWATALAAVNPFTILFHRKIWQPCVLPIVLVLMLMCWYRRERWWPAFFWGLLSLVVMQIHLAGLFLTLGFLGWTLIFEARRLNWKAWFWGSCLGGLGLLPWLYYLFFQYMSDPIVRKPWPRFFPLHFWVHWTTEPLGLGMEYSLGRDFRSFLAWPIVDGHPTYLVALAHLLLIGAGLVIFWRAGVNFWRERRAGRTLWQVVTTPGLQSAYAVCFGYGLILTWSCLGYYRHYHILSFPFMFAWLAFLAVGRPEVRNVMARWGRVLLVLVIVGELFVSGAFWHYLREHPEGVNGDFRQPYFGQMQSSVAQR